METDHHASNGRAIYLIIIAAMFLIAIAAKLMKGRSSKAARLDAWLDHPKNREKLNNWLIIGFFLFVFGGLTLYYELSH